MRSSSCLWIILSVTPIVQAIPAISNRGFPVSLVHTSSVQPAMHERLLGRERAEKLIRYTHEKYMATFAAYERNTGSRHPLDTRLSSEFNPTGGPSKRATPGTDPLQNEMQELWYGSIAIGSPPQNFMVDFDTGSADLIVPSVLCLFSCYGHQKYDPTTSSTSGPESGPFIALYGSGEIWGTDESDTVDLAGYQITEQAFGGATLMSPEFSKDNFVPDGLAGLAFPEISSLGVSPLMENLNKSGQLPQPVFSFKLSTQGRQSELVVGNVDTTAFKTSTVVSIPVTQKGYWQVSLDRISSPTHKVASSFDIPAIIDTGTTLLVAPADIVRDYFANIRGAQCGSNSVCTVPCATINQTAPTLTFGGADFKVAPESWNFGPSQSGSTDCIAGLATAPATLATRRFVIVGDVFLRNVFTIFNFGYPYMVQFAELA